MVTPGGSQSAFGWLEPSRDKTATKSVTSSRVHECTSRASSVVKWDGRGEEGPARLFSALQACLPPSNTNKVYLPPSLVQKNSQKRNNLVIGLRLCCTGCIRNFPQILQGIGGVGALCSSVSRFSQSQSRGAAIIAYLQRCHDIRFGGASRSCSPAGFYFPYCSHSY